MRPALLITGLVLFIAGLLIAAVNLGSEGGTMMKSRATGAVNPVARQEVKGDMKMIMVGVICSALGAAMMAASRTRR